MTGPTYGETEVQRLTRELDEARAEIARLRADLDVPCHHHERDGKAIQRIRAELEKLESGAKRNKTPSMYPDYEDGVLSACACILRVLEGK